MSEDSWPARIRAQFAQRVLDLRALHPGVGAALDQHAAEVRQAIASLGQPVGRDSLVGYLIGFWDGAHEAGWRVPAPCEQPLDFAALRLSAVCLMLDPEPAA
ncbi:DUF6401 family natural product biosynthesis protein [Planomonospora alba]|uniref:DUF6401 family natural product biosynthesis protein n=1 Tax=Planomonospora alba TaxID=161354 RepID=UPI0031EC3771